MRSRTTSIIVCTALAVAVLAVAPGQAQTAAAPAPAPGPLPGLPPGPPPTPLEQAVMEHNCRVPGQAMSSREVYEACLGLQLTSLREEFGVDVRKLSAGERRTIDKACSALRIERGRDAYVACLSERLLSLIVARGHQPPARVPMPADADPAVAAAVVPPPLVPPPAPAPSGPGAVQYILIGAAMLLAGAGGAWVLSNRHRKPSVVLCRECGEVAQSGDLCAACRHALAENQRRAAAERAEQQQAIADAAQRATEGSAPAASTGVPPMVAPVLPAPAMTMPALATLTPASLEGPEGIGGDARRAREAQELAQAERARDDERRREADRRRWEEAAASVIAEDAEPDPYQLLGVANGASPEAIRAAYDEAAARYAPDQVAHLGAELQAHYRKKAAAVERAYQQLTAVPAAPTA